MLKYLFIFLLQLFIQFTIAAQVIRVPQNQLLKHILSDTIPINNFIPIGTGKNIQLLPLTGIFKNYYQEWIKGPTGFYIIIKGSGQVYKAQKWNENYVDFQRIDSTEYFGYNFGALSFFYKDSLLSYGGYGFWHRNGVLRYFDDRNQWDRIKLNKEIPFLSDDYTFNKDHSKLFFYLNITGTDAISEDQAIDSFYVLNIKTRKINTLGKSNIDMKSFTNDFSILTPYGRFYTNPLKTGMNVLLDIESNTIYESISIGSNDYAQYLQKFASDADKEITFYQNGYIYASSSPFNKIDSIKFNFATFKNTNQKIYSDLGLIQNKISKPIKIALLIFILLLASSIVLLFGLKKLTTKNLGTNKYVSNEKINLNSLFSDLEKGFISELLNRSEKKGFCTTEEINNLLGVTQKTIEIQKKARTDFIIRINQKFKDYIKSEDALIIRTRSEKDKRSFNYSISVQHQKELKPIIS